MRHLVLTPQMKMADLIESNYNVLLLLPRFGISLGIGERSVQDICREYHVAVELFLLVCRIYSNPDDSVAEEELGCISIVDLTNYLKRSHHYYRTERLLIIEKELKELNQKLDVRSGAILLNFFEEYKRELLNHFSYEEAIVFPYVDQLMQGKVRSDFKIHTFEDNHSNIEEKLHDLKNILIKYLPSNRNVNYGNLLFNIFLLEDDLNKHTCLEDHVLIPYVEKCEEEVL